MDFDPTKYGPDVARVLALDGNGNRLLPMKWEPCSNEAARDLLQTYSPGALFAGTKEPAAPMAGLWLYFNCFEEAHQLADSCGSAEGFLWHAILHRQEGDLGNAAYWFRKAGKHPIYESLSPVVTAITRRYPVAEFRAGRWDPYAFLSFWERAVRQPGSQQEAAAKEIQRAEWQLLFDSCARPES
jgi:hypothetical protein